MGTDDPRNTLHTQDELPFVSAKRVLRDIGGSVADELELISFHTISKGVIGEAVQPSAAVTGVLMPCAICRDHCLLMQYVIHASGLLAHYELWEYSQSTRKVHA